MWNAYYSPNAVDEVLSLLAQHGQEARVVAGATDLILEIERGVRRGINALLDITRIPGLDDITLDDQNWIHLGPLVTHNHCVDSRLIVEQALPLAQACWEVGAPQIRNRSTVAGNLITASPANDTITPLLALGAVITLLSQRGERKVSLAEFYSGYRQTVMMPDEFLKDISFPALRAAERGVFIKLGLRRAQAISVVDAAAVIGLEKGKIVRADVALGAVAPVIIHAASAEKYLLDKSLSPGVIERASRLAATDANPIDDVRGPADYRKDMIHVVVSRALRRIAEGREGEGFPAAPVMLWGKNGARVKAGLEQSLVHRTTDLIRTRINGKMYEIGGATGKTLLRMLREDALLIGTKEGCAEGECGACTVFLDDVAVMSCMVPAPRAHGAEIVTIEGLAANGKLHPLQQAFADEGAVQCGYCTPGFLMAGAKLLEERPHPDLQEISQSIVGNLCRCTGYYKILAAFETAGRKRPIPGRGQTE